MNGQSRNPQQRLVDLDEFARKGGCGRLFVRILDDDTTSERQVTVKPCGPNSTAIDLSGSQKGGSLDLVGDRSKLDDGTVRVTSNGRESDYVLGGGQSKCYQAALVPCVKVLATPSHLSVGPLRSPVISFGHTGESSLDETLRGCMNRMEWSRRSVCKLEKAIGSGRGQSRHGRRFHLGLGWLDGRRVNGGHAAIGYPYSRRGGC